MSATLRQRATDGEAQKATLIREAEELELTEGQRFIVPNYTIKQLLDAIPAHCYKRSALRSSLYVLQDATAIAILVYCAFHIDSFLEKFNLSTVTYYAARTLLWTAYSVMTGLFGTGLWVIAHECGHQAYSPSKAINNSVGWVLHSALLVPYHSWRISHGRHHAATGHLTRDEVFVPKTRTQLGISAQKCEEEAKGINVPAWRQAELREALEESPIMTLWNLFLHQLFGWPLYLIKNASGQKSYPKGTNHYMPSSVIFRPSQYWDIIISDIGIVAMFALLGTWVYYRGFREMFVLYFLPYLQVNHWLVFITYLQHTDPVLPHYSAKTWTFARGALATIDRNILGPISDICLHGITDTHVSHHISSKIPHYNAWEATEALKKFLGPHYHFSPESTFKAFYRSYRECIFIEDDADIAFYKNASGLAKKVGIEEGGNVSDSGVDVSSK